MHLTITPEIERLIEARLRAGKYSSPEDVVTAALSSLEQNERAGDFESGEWDRLLAEGEDSGPALDGETVLVELRELRSSRRDKNGSPGPP